MAQLIGIDSLSADFERAFNAAFKGAANKFGKAVVKAQKRKYKSTHDNAGGRRLSSIGFAVNDDGSMAFFDQFPQSVLQEDGGSVVGGPFLAIPTSLGHGGAAGANRSRDADPSQEYRAKLRAAGETFVKKVADGRLLVMRKSKNSNDRRVQRARQVMGIRSSRTSFAFPIATLVRSVHFSATLGYEKTIDSHISQFEADLEQRIIARV
jgi:hypothetical protein